MRHSQSASSGASNTDGSGDADDHGDAPSRAQLTADALCELLLGNDAQRLVLAARDGGCVGCELSSEHTQAHHIDYFDNSGLTEIPNLASLCEPCH